MRYILTGFTHEMGSRVFAFQGIDDDRLRTEYRVKADLTASRQMGITIQELPLLCRGVLERRDETAGQSTFIYTEAEMRCRALARAAELASSRRGRPPRKTQADVSTAGQDAAHGNEALPIASTGGPREAVSDQGADLWMFQQTTRK